MKESTIMKNTKDSKICDILNSYIYSNTHMLNVDIYRLPTLITYLDNDCHTIY